MRSTANSLVLFDIDGTLMRGAGVHHKNALVDGIRKVTGHATTLEGVSTAGMLDRDLIISMLHAQSSQRKIRQNLRTIMQECASSYLRDCTADLTPFLCRGVSTVLATLRSLDITLGLVTGNLAEIGWRKVELAGIRSFFSVGAFAEDGLSRARLAQVAAHRARRMKLADRTTKVSLIGDHTNDVAAAKANGFQSIAVASGVLTAQELALAGPDVLVEHLEALDLSALT